MRVPNFSWIPGPISSNGTLALSYARAKIGYNDGNDSVVLNSVANVGKSIPVLAEYPLILCYLDNDTAGRAAVARLRREFGDRVSDKSALYPDHKDLNDYLQSFSPKILISKLLQKSLRKKAQTISIS